MARTNELFYALNAGGVDRDGLTRIDLEKLRMAGEHPVENWWPRVLGPMGLRPGTEFVQATGARTRDIPFVRSRDQKVLLAMSHLACTVCQDGTPLQVAAVGTTVANSGFVSGGGGWSDVSDTGPGTGGVATLGVAGAVAMTATRWRAAATEQAVAVAAPDREIRHTVVIEVERGPVFFRIGSTSGGEEIASEVELLTGLHKLSFVPGVATIYLRFRSEDRVVRIIRSCAIEPAGPFRLVTPWTEDRLPRIAYDQSADVLFIADGVTKPKRIERRGPYSWSIVDYITRNGPLSTPNTSKISLTPSAYHGNGTMTASRPYFKPSHVGTLFELTHGEQHVVEELIDAGQTTDKVTVRGLFSSTVPFNDRNFGYTINFASFVGTIVLERSTDPDAAIWSEVKEHPHSAGSVSVIYNDEQSNLLASYRLRVKSYTSGAAPVTITYLSGSTIGLARVTEYVSATSVNYEAVTPIGGTGATFDWRGPTWSDDLGWPRVPRLYDGRLWWFQEDAAYGSVVDDFSNYDDGIEGDSGPIVRSIGTASAEGVLWALDLQRLVVGTTGFEASIRSSSFDEPLTPTQFTVRTVSTLGSSLVPAVKHDRGGFFVQAGGRRLYELSMSEAQEYASRDATRLVPSALEAGVVAVAVQRQPDTRVHLVTGDGRVVVLTYERDDKVGAFTVVAPSGMTINGVAVLPGADEDEVYYTGTAGGVFMRWRLAKERDQRTAACLLLDNASVLTGSVSAISGAGRFEGQTVQVWADGKRLPDVSIIGGAAPLGGGPYARVVYGKSYKARFTSVKLAFAAQLGAAVGQTKIVKAASLILSKSCLDGIRIGKDAEHTDPMPDFINGALRTPGQIVEHYDQDMMPIQSEWQTDSRIYVEADSAAGPATVQGIVFHIETRDGARGA